MTVAEYIKKTQVPHITFIKVRARKDAHTPFYHPEYQTTPLFYTYEVEEKGILSDYIIMNDRQASITYLSGADWNTWIKKGMARCLLVVSPEDYKLLHYDDGMIRYIDERLKP